MSNAIESAIVQPVEYVYIYTGPFNSISKRVPKPTRFIVSNNSGR